MEKNRKTNVAQLCFCFAYCFRLQLPILIKSISRILGNLKEIFFCVKPLNLICSLLPIKRLLLFFFLFLLFYVSISAPSLSIHLKLPMIFFAIKIAKGLTSNINFFVIVEYTYSGVCINP